MLNIMRRVCKVLIEMMCLPYYISHNECSIRDWFDAGGKVSDRFNKIKYF